MKLSWSITLTSILMSVGSRLIPGVGRVHAQVLPFSQAWQSANFDALQREGPLWVALGDSMSQGIGAHDISGGWVGQLRAGFAAAGHDTRLVNLSVTGARVHDVLNDQIPRLHDLGAKPDLVTVLVGANDMLVRRRRAAAVDHFAMLIQELHSDNTVIATLPRRNSHALAINALIDDAASTSRLRIADMRGRTLRSLRGTRSEDHFHPNERGYATITDAFAAALDLSQRDDPPGHRPQ